MRCSTLVTCAADGTHHTYAVRAEPARTVDGARSVVRHIVVRARATAASARRGLARIARGA
eukprot:31035-Eustigmatos_ZCMA.PRE.1